VPLIFYFNNNKLNNFDAITRTKANNNRDRYALFWCKIKPYAIDVKIMRITVFARKIDQVNGGLICLTQNFGRLGGEVFGRFAVERARIESGRRKNISRYAAGRVQQAGSVTAMSLKCSRKYWRAPAQNWTTWKRKCAN